MAKGEGNYSCQGIPLPPPGKWGGREDAPYPEECNSSVHREKGELGYHSTHGALFFKMYPQSCYWIQSLCLKTRVGAYNSTPIAIQGLGSVGFGGS